MVVSATGRADSSYHGPQGVHRPPHSSTLQRHAWFASRPNVTPTSTVGPVASVRPVSVRVRMSVLAYYGAVGSISQEEAEGAARNPSWAGGGSQVEDDRNTRRRGHPCGLCVCCRVGNGVFGRGRREEACGIFEGRKAGGFGEVGYASDSAICELLPLKSGGLGRIG
jgi:hypothetical protein